MRKTSLIIAVIASLLFQVGAACAVTSLEARQSWQAAANTRIQAEAAYKQAQLDYAANKTTENDQKVIDSAKTVLNDVLDEVQAWLNWKNEEAKESDVSADIKANIATDVNANMAKIADLRNDVAKIKTRVDVAGVFLKMVTSYVQLLADVARNSGAVWVYAANQIADKTAGYEIQLRTTANGLVDNANIIPKLDLAKQEIDTARTQINAADTAYKAVVLPGTPLIKFAEGNSYLRQAKINLAAAVQQLQAAFNLIVTSK